MKKLVTAVVLSSAVLAMASTASADITLTEQGSFTGADLINGTNLLLFRDSEGCYLADLEGNPLTEAIYSTSFSFESEGYITGFLAEEGFNTQGMMDLSANVIIPFEYGKISVENEHWAVCYKLVEATATQYDFETWIGDNYLLIDTADIYHLEDDSAALVGTLTRDQINDVNAEGDYIFIQNRTDNSISLYDASFSEVASDLDSLYSVPEGINAEPYITFRDNGQYGIQDVDGNVLMEPAWQYIYSITENEVEVSTGDHEGLTDLSGNILVPAEYDDVRSNYYAPVTDYGTDGRNPHQAAGYYAVIKDGKVGFVDSNGNVTCEPKLSKDLVNINGASGTYTDLEGLTHILAADGTDTTVPEDITSLYAVEYSNGLLYKGNNSDYDPTLFDWHGNALLTADDMYTSPSLSGDGKYLLVETDYDNCVLYAVDYGTISAAAPADDAAEAPAEGDAAEAPAEGGEAEAPAEGDAAEAPAEGGETDLSAVATLIKSAATLAETDVTGNASAIQALLESAAAALGSEKPEVATLLAQAEVQIAAGADASTVCALLNGAAALLG